VCPISIESADFFKGINSMEHEVIEPNSLPDVEIIKKIINSETALFQQLIIKYNPFLYKIARGYGFNHQNSEDILQDTQIAVYCNLSQFKSRSTFKTWLTKIMIHKCLYKLQYGTEKHEECSFKNETVDGGQNCKEFEDAEIIFLKKELREMLQKTVNQLPFFYKVVFILREVEGYSVGETATLLNISDINVRVRLTRAKTMLQKKLKSFYSPRDF
jgi:RNA polymerase sigma-70 factor (ECF subfamily)